MKKRFEITRVSSLWALAAVLAGTPALAQESDAPRASKPSIQLLLGQMGKGASGNFGQWSAYTEIKPGRGARPKPADSVEVRYATVAITTPPGTKKPIANLLPFFDGVLDLKYADFCLKKAILKMRPKGLSRALCPPETSYRFAVKNPPPEQNPDKYWKSPKAYMIRLMRVIPAPGKTKAAHAGKKRGAPSLKDKAPAATDARSYR